MRMIIRKINEMPKPSAKPVFVKWKVLSGRFSVVFLFISGPPGYLTYNSTETLPSLTIRIKKETYLFLDKNSLDNEVYLY